jgi:uncharacterized protein involved in exopolysaccharide biosynthesis
MTTEYVPMDDVIDLRKYINILLKKIWWIIGFTVGFGLLGLALAFLLPNTYQATAIAAITQARNELRFDPRIQTVNEFDLNYQSFATLATSDTIIQELYESLGLDPEQVSSPQALRSSLEAEVRSDLIIFNVSDNDPVMAAEIANQWLDIFILTANQIYNTQSQGQILFFETQLTDASVELDQAQNALAEFESRNRESFYNNRLTALRSSLTTYTDRQQSLQILQRDLASLLSQLEAQPAGQPAPISVQYSVLLLQNRAYQDSSTSADVQVQITDNGENSPTIGAQIQQMQALVDVVNNQLEELDQLVSDLEPQIQETQMLLQQTLNEKDNLNQSLTIARSTYNTLANKVEEARIAAQDTSGQVRLASNALPPRKSSSPGLVLLVAAGAAFGFLLSTVGILLLAWWRDTD